MARRKSAPKIPKKQPNRKSIVQASKFPAERLPSELIHIIFTNLEPTEAAAFRLVGRVVAAVGLQYLVPTAYLALNEESYDRLLAIAEHPIVSKYVVKLMYETEGLKFIDRRRWDHMITLPPPHHSASARTWRAHRRQATTALSRAWLIYEEYHASQKRVQQAHFFPEKVAEAMKQLPNLKTIFATADGAYKRYLAEIKNLLPTGHLRVYYYFGRSSDADTTSSILSAAQTVDLRCQHFLSYSINLQVLGQVKNNFASLKRSMLQLETMDLHFTGFQRDIESISMESLERVIVLDFLASAPKLQRLSLAFETSRYDILQMPFNRTIGGLHWPFLKAVSLVGLCSHEYELRDFFKRHARTLKCVSLEDMRQYKGSWHMTFQDMRRAFAFGQQLETCRVSGYFSNHPDNLFVIKDTLISDYVQATEFEDISLDEYCEIIGIRPIQPS
ncbi:hypothetical protein BDR22DRAFT_718291 [Usnea florida]